MTWGVIRVTSGGSKGGGGGGWGAGPHISGKKNEEMTEGREASWPSNIELGPLLSSKSGSATGYRDAQISRKI